MASQCLDWHKGFGGRVPGLGASCAIRHLMSMNLDVSSFCELLAIPSPGRRLFYLVGECNWFTVGRMSMETITCAGAAVWVFWVGCEEWRLAKLVLIFALVGEMRIMVCVTDVKWGVMTGVWLNSFPICIVEWRHEDGTVSFWSLLWLPLLVVGGCDCGSLSFSWNCLGWGEGKETLDQLWDEVDILLHVLRLDTVRTYV